MTSKPSLVFVPGAWHKPSTWDKVIALLSPTYTCIAVTLPSTLSNPDITLQDDINAVRSAITGQTTQGHDVVLIVHSYGGAVGASALKNLTKPKEENFPPPQEHTAYAIGLITLASGFGPAGLSFIDGLGGVPPPTWRVDSRNEYLELTNIIPTRELFYHDLPVSEGDFWVQELVQQAARPLMHKEGAEWAYTGWKDVPVWAMVTSEDKAFPVEAQRYMVGMAREQGARITDREVVSGHSPMLSLPKVVAGFIDEAVGDFCK